MKIGIYCDCNSRGGVFIYTVRFASALKSVGIEVTILTHAARDSNEEVLLERLASASTTTVIFEREKCGAEHELASSLSKYINNSDIQVYVPNYRLAPMLAIHYITGAKVVLVCHNNHPSYYKMIFRFDSLVDLVIFPNQSAMHYCNSELVRHRAKYVYIPHFVDVKFTNVIEKAELLTLIYFGRIEQEQKCVFEIVKIAKELKCLGVEFSIKIFGDGGDFEPLRELIESAYLSDSVFLERAKPFEQLAPIISHSHFSILTSTYEGFCYSAAESMALGTPLACYTNEAIEDYVSSENGLTVNWGAAKELAISVVNLVNAPATYNTMANNAAQYVQSNMEKELVIEKYLEQIKSALCDNKVKKWPTFRPRFEPEGADIFGRSVEYLGKCFGVWK